MFFPLILLLQGNLIIFSSPHFNFFFFVGSYVVAKHVIVSVVFVVRVIKKINGYYNILCYLLIFLFQRVTTVSMERPVSVIAPSVSRGLGERFAPGPLVVNAHAMAAAVCPKQSLESCTLSMTVAALPIPRPVLTPPIQL